MNHHFLEPFGITPQFSTPEAAPPENSTATGRREAADVGTSRRKRYLEGNSCHVGRFVWSDYWHHWDEVLAASVDAREISHWTVRTVGSDVVRTHNTRIRADLIFDAPVIVGGRHRSPFF